MMSENILLTTTPRHVMGPPASYPMVTENPFLEVKRPGRDADNSPSSAEDMNAWSYTSTPHILSWHDA
jgi:hypothetical protein